MKCRIADFNVEIKHRGQHVARLCEKYLADFDEPDLTVQVSDEEIEAERKIAELPYSASYFESVCAYRNLCVQLPQRDAFVLHGALFKVDDRGIIFVARSGTGKSTHMLYWQQLLGDKLKIINGDKPIVRLFDGIPYAYGTPWCGKEGLSLNERVELTDICLIERSEKNETIPIDKQDAISFLMMQILWPKNMDDADKMLSMLDTTIRHCNIWKIGCNLDPDSARVSYHTIFGE